MSVARVIERLRSYDAFVRQYGLRRCVYRAVHDWRRRHGALTRRLPAWRWEERPLASWLRPGIPGDAAGYRAFRAKSPVQFFFPPGRLPVVPGEWLAQARVEADALLAGKFRYFSAHMGELGFPEPDWLLNPFTGYRDPGSRHWAEDSDFEAGRGDIKWIWEPSRFGWAFALARTYAGTRDERYADAFWRLLESWLARNPPQIGPNWMCGQETAFRALACAFAGHVFAASPATTDERWAKLVVLLAASAERIAGNIGFAIAQRSNHAASEATGLFTIGLLFPELMQARHWREVGQAVLESEARDNNWPDGSYIQHSVNYQRMTLQCYVWALRLAELNGVTFADDVRERLRSCYQFLYALQDTATGWLPNYGPNDGGLVLPLSGCEYPDFRPAVADAHRLFTGEWLYDRGPWDEGALWLFGAENQKAPLQPVARTREEFPDGGYYLLCGRESRGVIRCFSYRCRPGQADMLHLDLWWRGVNVLRDSGTYAYYDPERGWNRYFLSTAAHNTVVVGGADQMIKGPRFRWNSLLKSRYIGRRRLGPAEIWEGEHYGYRRLPCRATHRRTVCRFSDECWVIVDDILGVGSADVELNWQLPDLPCEARGADVDLQTQAGRVSLRVFASAACDCHVLRGVDEAGVRAGWDSRYYGVRVPAPTLKAQTRADLPLRWVTLVALGTACDVLSADVLESFAWRIASVHAAGREDRPAGDEARRRLTFNPPRAGLSPIRGLEVDGQPCASRS